MIASESLPLTGLRIIDSTDERGEFCSRILADLGADVIRTEPSGGSASRHLPPLAADGTSLWFATRNANKRGVTLDVLDPADRLRLHELLAGADVWIESNRPGVLAAAGLSPADVAAAHPQLVITSITDFGQTGPYRDFIATDDVLTSMSGMLFRSGVPSKPPLLPPGSLAYDVSSVSAAIATLAAIWQRQTTGRGQHLDVSALMAYAQITDWSLPNWAAVNNAGGHYAQLRSGSGPVYPLFPCASGYVRLIILSTRQWRAFRAWIGEPDILQDEHWDHVMNRIAVQDDILAPLYTEFFSDKTSWDLAAEAQRRGIVMTPVLTPAEVLTLNHFSERGTFAEMEVAPGLTGAVMTGIFEIDGEHVGPRHRAPQPGEHDAEVFAGVPSSGATGAPAVASAPIEPAPPLVGLKVLDFGHGGVGVEGGRMFAEYGADVIKIESWTYPDFVRGVMGTTISGSFVSSSRLKRSFSVNAKNPEGLRLVEQLVRWADVVIENNSTGTMVDMGLGYERLRDINPAIVMVSSQLMGSTGPWKDWIGYGPSTRPAGGLTHLWNFADGGMPPGSAAIHPDHLAGRLTAVAALAGLVGRNITRADGVGMHAEIAQVDVVVALLADLYLKESIDPGSVGPEGNDSSRGAPWGVFPCTGTDCWCTITVRSDADWSQLRIALRDPDWTRRPDLQTTAGRLAARDFVNEQLATWTSERSDHDVMEALQAVGVPAGYMVRPEDMAHDPHFVARHFPQPVDQPALGPLLLEGPFFESSGMPLAACGPAALLGQHTREIARDILGLDDAAIDALIADGALFQNPDIG